MHGSDPQTLHLIPLPLLSAWGVLETTRILERYDATEKTLSDLYTNKRLGYFIYVYIYICLDTKNIKKTIKTKIQQKIHTKIKFDTHGVGIFWAFICIKY